MAGDIDDVLSVLGRNLRQRAEEVSGACRCGGKCGSRVQSSPQSYNEVLRDEVARLASLSASKDAAIREALCYIPHPTARAILRKALGEEEK